MGAKMAAVGFGVYKSAKFAKNTSRSFSEAANKTTALQKSFPSNDGFLGNPQRQFLEPGQRINRFGGTDNSRFFSPAGTPGPARALPPGTRSQPLRTFEVVKPFEIQSGTVAPAFGQPGLGTQFQTPINLQTLLKRDIIREVTQ